MSWVMVILRALAREGRGTRGAFIVEVYGLLALTGKDRMLGFGGVHGVSQVQQLQSSSRRCSRIETRTCQEMVSFLQPGHHFIIS